MLRLIVLSISSLFFLSLSTPSHSEGVKIFEDDLALQSEIEKGLATGKLGNLVEAVAPPGSGAIGRIRRIEGAFDGTIPSFSKSVTVFESSTTGITRKVTGWWNGDNYIYVGTLVHNREAGAAVLDFILTDDVSRAQTWYLTGRTD